MIIFGLFVGVFVDRGNKKRIMVVSHLLRAALILSIVLLFLFNMLHPEAARKLGKEAAILMPSGTMANLASLMAHCPRGSKVWSGYFRWSQKIHNSHCLP